MTKLLHGLLLGSALSLASVFTVDAVVAQAEQPDQARQPAGIIDDYAAAEDPPAFDDPGKAVEAFKARLAANDFDGLAKLLGLDAAKVKTGEDAMENFALIR
ncbi:DUF2950 domain-containing protein, partial [Ensifer sp. MPMI2T]